MADFATAYAPLAQYEGGYSNNAADRGGETYAGIARNFFPSWAGWPIVDKWKKAVGTKPSKLNKVLSTDPELRPLVEGWYKAEWWDRLGLGTLPQALANEIFEQAVNLGKAGAGRKVQTVCNAFNYKGGSPLFPDLKVDGAIGPKTLAALRTILESRADEAALVHALNAMQGAHYLELAAKKASQRVFTTGWMKRTHCE
ncbi:MAG: surface-binding protein, partial [Desulfovibrio sp.]|nr:surface-binding protein [Desulfovibrio sp.]